MSIQPITVKARKAIRKFVYLMMVDEQKMTTDNAVDWTMLAERMYRDDLYRKLEKRGYRWISHRHEWVLFTNKKTG